MNKYKKGDIVFDVRTGSEVEILDRFYQDEHNCLVEGVYITSIPEKYLTETDPGESSCIPQKLVDKIVGQNADLRRKLWRYKKQLRNLEKGIMWRNSVIDELNVEILP